MVGGAPFEKHVSVCVKLEPSPASTTSYTRMMKNVSSTPWALKVTLAGPSEIAVVGTGGTKSPMI